MRPAQPGVSLSVPAGYLLAVEAVDQFAGTSPQSFVSSLEAIGQMIGEHFAERSPRVKALRPDIERVAIDRSADQRLGLMSDIGAVVRPRGAD